MLALCAGCLTLCFSSLTLLRIADSHNHPMFTSNEVYAYQGLAGVQPHPSAVGYDRVLIKPSPPQDGSLQSVSASLTTVRGVVSSSWSVYSNGTFALTLCVPPNLKAEVWMPAKGGGWSAPAIDPGTCCGCVFSSQLI
jgi:hypothetical protein